MFRLVQNEYIKSLKKLSTKIMFIMIVVFVLGYVGLAKFGQMMIEQDMVYYESGSDYSYEISDAKAVKYDGYEYDVEKYTFMQENEITVSSWKHSVAERIFEYDYSEDMTMDYVYPENLRNEFKAFVINNDWKGYCKKYLETAKDYGMTKEGFIWEYQYRLDNDIPLPDSYRDTIEWENLTINSVTSAKNGLAQLDSSSSDYAKTKAEYEEAILIGTYRLDNNESVNVKEVSDIFMADKIGFWNVFKGSSGIIGLIGLLVIILTGSSVSNEFSNGTIKFLLINPVKRWKILVSKYIMSLSLGIAMILILYVVTALASMVFFGAGNLGAVCIEVENGEIVTSSGFLNVFVSYIFKSVNVVVMATLAFAISSLVRSSALAIGVSIFAMLSGNTAVMLLKEGFRQDWARYLVFANTDLEAVMNGTTYFSNHTIGFALAVIGIHLFVFFLIAWDGFTRREI